MPDPAAGSLDLGMTDEEYRDAVAGHALPYDLDSAASDTPDDPDPGREDRKHPENEAKKPPDPKTMRDIRAKLLFWLEIVSMPMQAIDPVCGKAMADNFPNIATKATPILCQSPEVVKWFTKAGNFALWADLAMACWPVVQVIIAHHIAKTMQDDKKQPLRHVNPNMYPAA